MTGLSNYMESGLLHGVFRGQSFSKPTEVAIAFCSSVPADSDTGATLPEIPSGINGSGTGYRRISLGNPATSGNAFWSYSTTDHAAGSGVIKNSVVVTLDTALVDWGYVSGVALVDDFRIGSGNVLIKGELEHPRIVYMGDALRYPVGELRIKFD